MEERGGVRCGDQVQSQGSRRSEIEQKRRKSWVLVWYGERIGLGWQSEIEEESGKVSQVW